jgi:DNA-directed RNA polymerase alpha subunit
MTLRNFGVKSLQELADRLGELGLPLIQSEENLAESADDEAETE